MLVSYTFSNRGDCALPAYLCRMQNLCVKLSRTPVGGWFDRNVRVGSAAEPKSWVFLDDMH